MKKARYVFLLSIAIVVFTIILSIFYGNYENTIKTIESEYKTKHMLVEESIYNTIKYADAIGQMLEESLNDRMKDYSLVMLDKYSLESDVLNWDLEKFKKQFNDFEIYVINQDLKIVKTTFEADLGLDFRNFPSFSKVLDARLHGDSFVTDGLAVSTNTGELMKYSYMPTPDHKYLFQLSVNVNRRFPVMNNVDIFSVAQILKDQHPSVEGVSIYKHNVDGTGILSISKHRPFYSIVKDEMKAVYIQKALSSRETQVNYVIDELTNTSYTEKYIPYFTHQQDEEYSWWNSHVVEIKYNNSILFEEVDKARVFFFRSILIIAIIYFLLAFVVIYLIHRSEYMAYHDHLTGLPNKKLFEVCINEKILNASKKNTKLAVLYIDLNNFKKVNDTYGHDIGDKVLRETAKGLKSILRKGDMISRIGGDEFCILVSNIQTLDGAIKVVEKINDLLSIPIETKEYQFYIKLSIGISIYPDDGSKPEMLMHKADLAMYRAKNHQLNYVMYSNEFEEAQSSL